MIVQFNEQSYIWKNNQKLKKQNESKLVNNEKIVYNVHQNQATCCTKYLTIIQLQCVKANLH